MDQMLSRSQKINVSSILDNSIINIQNTIKSKNKVWPGAEKRVITYSAIENNPAGGISPYGQHVKFRLRGQVGLIANVTLYAKVNALAGTGGTEIKFVDYLGYNFLDQRLGVQIRDVANNTEIERILPQAMYQLSKFGLDTNDAVVEKNLVLGGLASAARVTAAAGVQTFAIQMNHFSDLIHAKIPLHKTKSGLEFVFNIANQNDIISTDHTAITSGLVFSQFELQVEYYLLDDAHLRYVDQMVNSQNGLQFISQRVRIFDDTLAAGGTQYTVQVNQNKNLDYCQLMTFVIRPSTDLSSTTNREYNGSVSVSSYYYEEQGRRLQKNDFDDFEYKNIYLANARVTNLTELKSLNLYSYIFSHDLPLSLAKQTNESGKRRPLGGHVFNDGNQELSLTFAAALGVNHQVSVYSYEESIVKLSLDGTFHIL